MNYCMPASVHRPAAVIFLVDASDSVCADSTAQEASIGTGLLHGFLSVLIHRCMRQQQVLPRYRTAVLAYTDTVVDITGGFQTIDALAREGIQVPELGGSPEPALAFEQALKMLELELPGMKNNPAPLVCHLSSGRITGPDPRPFAASIRQLQVDDGPALVMNVLLNEYLPGILSAALRTWTGVLPDTPLPGEQMQILRDLSSPLPALRQKMMREVGFQLDPEALMLFPAHPDLVSMACPMTVTS